MASLLRCVPVCLLALLSLAPATAPQAAPQADPWPRWSAHDPAASTDVDHAAWQAFLSRYLRPSEGGITRVAYAAVSAADRLALDAYVAHLETVPISAYARPAQLAFWVNLYNALTIRTVLEHYPVSSIRDIRISPGWFSVGPWGRALTAVEGVALSLDDIEHRILRPLWRDPRVHYALNCASLGCPDLQAEAFRADNAERLLEQGAEAYVNHPRGVDASGEELVVSSIYVWFIEDFGDSDGAVLGHLRRYARPELAARLERFERIDGHRYDWSLNDVDR